MTETKKPGRFRRFLMFLERALGASSRHQGGANHSRASFESSASQFGNNSGG